MHKSQAQKPLRRLTYTCGEVGEILGVHEETVRRRAQKGEIPSHRIGDRWLIPRTWVNDVVDGKAHLWAPDEHGRLTRQDPEDRQ